MLRAHTIPERCGVAALLSVTVAHRVHQGLHNSSFPCLPVYLSMESTKRKGEGLDGLYTECQGCDSNPGSCIRSLALKHHLTETQTSELTASQPITRKMNLSTPRTSYSSYQFSRLLKSHYASPCQPNTVESFPVYHPIASSSPSS